MSAGTQVLTYQLYDTLNIYKGSNTNTGLWFCNIGIGSTRPQSSITTAQDITVGTIANIGSNLNVTCNIYTNSGSTIYASSFASANPSNSNINFNGYNLSNCTITSVSGTFTQLTATNFYSSNINASNISSTGLINGCNLSAVFASITSLQVGSNLVVSNISASVNGGGSINFNNASLGGINYLTASNGISSFNLVVGSNNFGSIVAPLSVYGVSYHSSNVGVGTTIARQMLDVIGSIIASSNIGIGTTYARGPLDVQTLGTSLFNNGSLSNITSITTQNLNANNIAPQTGSNVSFGYNNITNLTNIQVLGTITTSNIQAIGSLITVNQMDSFTNSNLVINSLSQHAGTALIVSQSAIGTPFNPININSNVAIAAFFGPDGGLSTGTGCNVPVLYIGSNATVGINTYAPIAQFDVRGRTYLSSNVGVGTTYARQILDVVGQGLFSSNVGVGTTYARTNLDVIGWSLFSSNVGVGTTYARQSLDVVGQGIFSCNVGIGTTIATAALHVAGTSYMSCDNVGIGTVLPQSGINLDVRGLANISSNVGIGTTNALYQLSVFGPVAISGSNVSTNDVINRIFYVSSSNYSSGTVNTNVTNTMNINLSWSAGTAYTGNSNAFKASIGFHVVSSNNDVAYRSIETIITPAITPVSYITATSMDTINSTINSLTHTVSRYGNSANSNAVQISISWNTNSAILGSYAQKSIADVTLLANASIGTFTIF